MIFDLIFFIGYIFYKNVGDIIVLKSVKQFLHLLNILRCNLFCDKVLNKYLNSHAKWCLKIILHLEL